MKKTTASIWSATILFILASCGPTNSGSLHSSFSESSSNNGDGNSTNSRTSSETKSSSSVSSTNSSEEKKLLISQSVSTIKKGQTYLGESGFGISYDGVDVSSKRTRWFCTVASGTKTYDGWDGIKEAGTYTVTAKYSIKTGVYATSNSLTLAVTDTTIATKKGYLQQADYFSDEKTEYRFDKSTNNNVLKSTGTQKIIVIPIQSEDDIFEEAKLSKIQKVFFGANNETSWRSLEGYYKESSYGRLDITGVVSQPVTLPYTDSQLAALTADKAIMDTALLNEYKDYWNISWYAVEQAVASIKAGKTKAADGTTPIDISDYDNDKDGYIDGVWMVYSHPYATTNDLTKVWWAWTHHDYCSTDNANPASPVPFNLCWASYEFISQGYYTDGIDIDAHTICHETGHLMGLDDYYNTSTASDGAYEGVAGGVDMMDMNVGDHNAYSKLLFNWIKPFYADGTEDAFEITLRPFEETGDTLLLRDSSQTDQWNSSPFDEYMLFQFYTPTGLNSLDSKVYPEWSTYSLGTYTENGVQAFHCDSRLINENAVLGKDGSSWDETIKYTDTISDYAKTSTNYNATVRGTSNSTAKTSGIINGNYTTGSTVPFRELSAIPATGINSFQNCKTDEDLKNKYCKNSTLFSTDSKSCTFSEGKFAPLFNGRTTFNDGTDFGYTITITSVTNDGATLMVVKN